MIQPDRRTFLRTASAAISTGATRILGANDRVNLVIVGLGGRGRDHINFYSQLPQANIAAVCDVNQAAQERAVALVEKVRGNKPTVFADMRKAFDDKSIDAVSIVTPNHWHALATIWACQAGKDVYVEKPACHNVFEGRKMVEAALKYKRMVQVGSQSRSNAFKARAMKLLREGVIGEVFMARGLCFKRRKSILRTPDTPVPAGIDWSAFLGPAQMKPFSQNKFAYNWHWFWDTGNGDIGNQGVHEVDIARWGLGVDQLPKSVVSTGGKYIYTDDQETPNTQLATYDFGGKEIVFDVRGLLTGDEGGMPRRGGNTIGNLFYGSEGWLAMDEYGFQVYKGEKNEKVMDEKNTGKPFDTAPHMANFLAAVKSRDANSLNARVDIGVASANMCHLANISYRTGHKLRFDAKTQTFVGDAAANALLTRNYRAPYIVPERV